MRISGTDSTSVILSKKKRNFRKLKRYNKHTKLQFQTHLTRKIVMLSNATNQPKLTVELDYMCPRGLTGPPAMTLNVYAQLD